MEKNKLIWISFIVFFFIIGWFINSIFNTLNIHDEKLLLGADEQISPANRIEEKHLELSSEKLVINFPKIQLAHYSDTNSMDPIIDENSIGLEIIPESKEEIHVGDIVAYESGNDLIAHRIIEIDNDGEWYAIVKGDNSENNAEKIRFDQINYVLIGVLY